MALFKKLKLVDEKEIEQLIEKRLKQYDPRIHSMAQMQNDMTQILTQDNLPPEEKLAIFKASQQRYDRLKDSASFPPAAGEIADREGAQIPPVPFPLAAAHPPANNPLIPQGEPRGIEAPLVDNPVQEDDVQDPQQERPAVPVDHNLIGKLHPRNIDKATAMINIAARYPNILSYAQNTGEAIVEGRTIPHSSMQDLIISLYDDRGRLNLRGQDEFLTAFSKILGPSNISKFVTKRGMVKVLKDKVKENKKGQKGRGRDFSIARSKWRAKGAPPSNRLALFGKPVKVLHLY